MNVFTEDELFGHCGGPTERKTVAALMKRILITRQDFENSARLRDTELKAMTVDLDDSKDQPE